MDNGGQALASRRARILVIDDEEIIGRVIVRALHQHDVSCETNPRVAIERLAAGEDFDLILCDMKMPGLTGKDVHAEIAQRVPALLSRIVFLTGGAASPEIAAFLSSVPNGRLEKTVGPRAISAFVERQLQPSA